MKPLLPQFVTLAICSILAVPCEAFSGSGSESDPYIITSVADLKEIPNETTSFYRLANDITDCPCGVVGIFCGNFDGGGHSISLNFSENGSWSDNIGLFSSCSGATIENLTLKGAVSISKSRYYDSGSKKYYNGLGNWWIEDYYLVRLRIGAVCGVATSTTFKNIRNEASITGKITKARDGYYYYVGSDCGIGGLVGVAESCTFTQCCNTGSIVGSFGYDSDHPLFNAGLHVVANGLGALVGTDIGSVITISYAKCNISSIGDYSYEGAFIGRGESSLLVGSYFDGKTIDSPFIGSYSDGTLISDCISRVNLSSAVNVPVCDNCYIALLSGTETIVEGIKYIEPEVFSMQSWFAQNLPGWDFSEVWYMPSGSDATPLFRTEPSLTWSGNPKYGDSIVFTSTNTYMPLTIESTGDNDVTVDGNSITFDKAGIVTVKVSQDAVTPFKPIEKVVTFNVSKADLIVSAKNFIMSYGDELPTEDLVEYSGFIGDDSPESLDKLPDILFGGSPASDVGEYNILVSGASSSNYSFSYNKGTQTIEPRSITVKPVDTYRQYGSPNPPFKLEFEGWVNGQNESMVSQYPKVTTQAEQKSYVGEYILTVNGGEIHPNYKFKYLTGNLTIEKAPLLIGVKDAKRNLNEFNPEFELTFSGFKNGEDSSYLDELPDINCEASFSSPEGEYPIILSGGSDKNYVYTLKNGILVIEGQSGIEEVIYDPAVEGDARYFTLDGIEVTPENQNQLCPGIYIKIIDGKTSKILIR